MQFSSAVWCTTLPTTSLGAVSVLRGHGQHSLDFSIASMAYIQKIHVAHARPLKSSLMWTACLLRAGILSTACWKARGHWKSPSLSTIPGRNCLVSPEYLSR